MQSAAGPASRAQLQHRHKRGHQLAAAAAAPEQQQKPGDAAFFQPPDDLLGLLLHGIGLPPDDLVKGPQRRRFRLAPAVGDLLHGDDQVGGLLVVFIYLAPLHRLGVPGQDAAAKLAHRAERFGQRLDAKVRVLLLALFERGNELVHLALRLLILKRKQHARFDVH